MSMTEIAARRNLLLEALHRREVEELLKMVRSTIRADEGMAKSTWPEGLGKSRWLEGVKRRGRAAQP